MNKVNREFYIPELIVIKRKKLVLKGRRKTVSISLR